MHFNSLLSCFCGFLLVELSRQTDCTSQAVVFDENLMAFGINSDPNDLQPKNCKYTFTVPKYYVPSITVATVKLHGDNRITARQFSEYGGSKSYPIFDIGIVRLAPVNFTLEIALPAKTADDAFNIVVSVRDATPARTGQSFMVSPHLGEIIDSDSILGNSSLVQQFDDQHPLSIFSIRVAVFTEGVLLYGLLRNIHVYDTGLYKGDLYDVLVAENISETCSGTQFAIVNTNSGSVGIYSILISAPYQWNGQVFVRPAPSLNATESYTATNGLTVFHEIKNSLLGTSTPSIYQQISFRGDGTLQVYAGCLTGPQESRRIATITPLNAANYEQLMLFGRCRTYVLSQGVFQWSVSDNYFSNYRHSIGRKGVIMSDSYPYRFTGNDTLRKYLIQAPSSNQNIIVEYEVAFIAANAQFQIEQDLSPGENSMKSLTSTSGNFTSQVTYQQLISYDVPKGSDGLLVRYTVVGSASTSLCVISMLFAFLVLVIRV